MRTKRRMPRLTGKRLSEVRREMNQRGFTLVSTPCFFDDELLLRLGNGATVLPFDSNRWWKLQSLARYACWLEELLDRALPEESVALATLEVRREEEGFTDPEVDRLHADGSYIRSIYTLYGRPTLYREAGAEWPVPSDQTLVMTAHDRTRAVGIPCTLHRRPGAGAARGVIVGSFEPCRQETRRDEVYRRVVRTRRS